MPFMGVATGCDFLGKEYVGTFMATVTLTHGYSHPHSWLQSPSLMATVTLTMATVPLTHGYSHPHPWLQSPSPMATVTLTHGYSHPHPWLQSPSPMATVTLTCMALRIVIFSVKSFFMSSSILLSCSEIEDHVKCPTKCSV